jgi:hypothetical protein
MFERSPMSRIWTLAVLAFAGLSMAAAAVQPPGGPGKEKDGKDKKGGVFATVRGTVDSITTAPKGEADGATLADGTWIHWPPHLEERFRAVVKKGERIRAAGYWETGPKGDKKLEASTVTNLDSNRTVENPDRPTPDAGGATSSRSGEVEERLRSLEEKLDRLIAMVERLQRDKK